MTRLKNKRGSMLMDVMVTVLLLSIAGVMFSASFPSGIACTRKAQNYKIALAIAQKKMEQLRGSGYASLTRDGLMANQFIDSSPTSSPYSFTQREAVASKLPQGTGSLAISDYSSIVRRVEIKISWRDKSGVRTITLSSMFAHRQPTTVT
jgi:Tfp pilus assembly protein PilV